MFRFFQFVRDRVWLTAACIFLFLLTLPEAYGLNPNRSLTQYVHRIWQMQQGLPQATIFSVLQTHDGYLWLGTQDGLVRFDGVHFTASDENGVGDLKNVWVRTLCEDHAHNLWIGTIDDGLMRLEEGVLTRFSTADGLPSPSIRFLAEGRNGEVWAATANGLARFSGGKFTVYRVPQGLSTNSLRALAAAPDGTLWTGGDGGILNRWDGVRFSHRTLTSLPPHTTIRALQWDRDGVLWIGTTEGLVRLKDDREERFTQASGLADDWIFSLFEGQEGGLWVGTKNGFSRYLNGEFESFRTRDGLSQSTVYALREDRRGDLWVGTKHGLNQFLQGRSISYSRSDGFPSNDAGPVVQDPSGSVWAGTLGAGLARFDGRRFAVLGRRQGLSSSTIYALAADTGGLWAGTNRGLDDLRDGRVVATYTTREGLPSDSVRALHRDSHGVLWAGTEKGPAVLVDGRFVAPPGSREHGPLPVAALAEDRERRVILAVDGGGVYVYEKGAFRPFEAGGLAPRNAVAIYRDHEGILWIGTMGSGLWLFHDGKFSRFGMKEGLFDDEIYGIAEDNRGDLWMACSKGVFSVKRADLLEFASRQLGGFTSVPYSPLDALRTIECRSGVQPAVWKAEDGRMWFSTIRGLLVVDPAQFENKLEAPATAIESVTVNGRPADPRHIGQLPPGDNNLEFRYTGLSFVAPGRITFRYLLEGFDKKWVNAGTRRQALYANLPPGNYNFRVLACNADGTCDPGGSSLGFTLTPRFYQRPAFLFLLAGSLAAAIWLFLHLRIRRLQERFHLILAERSRIARELHDTLIQGFSGVTMEMQALCSRLSSPEDVRTMKEIIHDAADSLHEARLSVAGLRGAGSKDTGLAAAIAQSAREMTDAKDIRLKLRLDFSTRGLPEEVEYNLFRIAQEAVNNSVKHSQARTVEVSLQSQHGGVCLAVRDDGTGLAASGEKGRQPGHYGIIGMQERANSIGAGFEIESKPGSGTLIRVRLPLRQSAGGLRTAEGD